MSVPASYLWKVLWLNCGGKSGRMGLADLGIESEQKLCSRSVGKGSYPSNCVLGCETNLDKYFVFFSAR